MIEMYIEKDIGSYETKFLGPFTFRQTVCLTLGAPVCWYLYRFLSPILSRDVTGFLVAIPALFCVAFGWLRPYGMTMEKFLKSIFVSMILAPRVRKYRIENLYEKELRKPEFQDRPRSAHRKKAKYKISKQAVA